MGGRVQGLGCGVNGDRESLLGLADRWGGTRHGRAPTLPSGDQTVGHPARMTVAQHSTRFVPPVACFRVLSAA